MWEAAASGLVVVFNPSPDWSRQFQKPQQKTANIINENNIVRNEAIVLHILQYLQMLSIVYLCWFMRKTFVRHKTVQPVQPVQSVQSVQSVQREIFCTVCTLLKNF